MSSTYSADFGSAKFMFVSPNVASDVQMVFLLRSHFASLHFAHSLEKPPRQITYIMLNIRELEQEYN